MTATKTATKTAPKEVIHLSMKPADKMTPSERVQADAAEYMKALAKFDAAKAVLKAKEEVLYAHVKDNSTKTVKTPHGNVEITKSRTEKKQAAKVLGLVEDQLLDASGKRKVAKWIAETMQSAKNWSIKVK